jgi:hypothetical protein
MNENVKIIKLVLDEALKKLKLFATKEALS